MIAKQLSQNLTSYDLLKSFALLLMVVDHVGLYLMPDTLELRWVGRLAAPMWLFLIGFARSRDFPWTLFAGVGVLQTVKLLTSADFWPIDILFSIVLIRLILDTTMRFSRRSALHMSIMVTALLALAIPSYGFVMYGTLGLLWAMFGALVRDQASDRMLIGFGLVLAVAYTAVSIVTFDFSSVQGQILLCAVLGVAFGVAHFKPKELPFLSENLPKPLIFLLKIGGRHSLAFYVAHLIFLMLIAALLKIGDYHFI